MNAAELSTAELLKIMNHGYIRAEIAAATAEYWRRVESGNHVRPAPVETLGANESDATWHANQLAKLD